MKILVISSGHFLDDDRIVVKQGFSLAKLGHDVTYCAQDRFPIEHDKVKFLEVNEPYGSMGEHKAKGKSPKPQNRLLKLFKLYKHAKALRPDLIVAHDFETGMLAWLIKKRLKIPYVFDSHEFFQYTVSAKFGRIVSPFMRLVVMNFIKRFARNAEAITAVSPENETFYRRISSVPTRSLFNAPLVEYFPYSEEGNDKITIVHEGNFTLGRGALQIAEALPMVRKNHDFKLLVLGTVANDVKRDFDKLIEKSKKNIDIEMPGRLPWTEFGRVESQGDIGLICMQPTPNNFGGLSNKLYTYMACGLAVLGMKGSQTEMMIDKYRCGIAVDPTDPKAIAEGINYLIEHPEERLDMIRNGRKAIDEELGWHCMEEVMKELYSKVEENIGRSSFNS